MLLFVLGLVASVPLAILANLVTPAVRDALAARLASRRQARVRELRKEMALIAEYRDGGNNRALAHLARQIIYTIGNFTLAVLLNVTAFVSIASPKASIQSGAGQLALLGFIMLLVSMSVAIRTETLCRKIYDVKWYGRYTARVLRKLGEPSEPEPEHGTAEEPPSASSAGQLTGSHEEG